MHKDCNMELRSHPFMKFLFSNIGFLQSLRLYNRLNSSKFGNEIWSIIGHGRS